ncbi:hypothetical protein [Sphingomonas sp. LHG3406-1]|uniref:hypothetical protein n=1 Tax=Sphingomonas sp. LHG3406-1 TaxID=2804617 RepID=UPI0026044695|nr:hypothetical protein [Sphingomonas sp. LHG3406-1]
MTETDAKVTKALARFERVMTVIDEREGPVAMQARRERQRKLRRYGRATRNAVLALLTISILTIVVGVVTPIGMFGFLAAVGLAIAIAGLLFFWGSREETTLPTVPQDIPNGEMVQRFDSFLYRTRRALPAPAQPVLDQITAELTTLKQTLERVDLLDPDAQDARRLMSVHLPGLIDRYANVPPAYRSEADAEGKTVDQRLVEGLAASRTALSEVSERLAKRDVDAFSTQGRFIESKYGQAE